MTRFTKDSRFRLRDFRRRKSYSPDSVYIHSQLEQEYIPIHPFSDETDILKKLDMSPAECKSVDAWWNMGTDMCLLGVTTRELDKDMEVGIYASWPKEKQRYLFFLAVINSKVVSRSAFEDVMSNICKLELIASEKLRRILPSKLSLIGNIS